MTPTKFKYHLDHRSRYITWGTFIAITALLVGAHFIWGSSYLPAWFLLLLLCVITLFVLSFPRYLTIDEEMLQIHCIVELTRIHVEEIETVQRIDSSHFQRIVPLLGSYGFGGYFGYWIHLSDWSICKLYTTERKQLVLIEDIYEDIYIVNCSDPDLLVTLCTAARDKKRDEIYRKTLTIDKLSPDNSSKELTANSVPTTVDDTLSHSESSASKPTQSTNDNP